jgi:2-keto-3-deoxy-L-fuconate dehydrogenase
MSEQKALVTCADTYMGPAIAEKFTQLGMTVSRGASPMSTEQEVQAVVSAAGEIDVLIANLAEPPRSTPVQNIDNSDWESLFRHLVDPLMYLVRAVAPQMIERGSGKIIAVTSAAPLRGIPNNSAYCAARGAQNAFIKAVGLELARKNIQVNAIGQNYINNDTYYPDELLANEKFIDHVQRNVPTRKIGEPQETAELAAYLANPACTHIVAQVIPLAGGWAT